MKKKTLKTLRIFVEAWKKIPWKFEFEPYSYAPPKKFKWPSGPAYEAKGPFGKFIEFMKLNIEKQTALPAKRVNWPSGPAYATMNSFGKFKVFCQQNVEFYSYCPTSSINTSISSPQNLSSGIINSNPSNLSQINPSSGLPMINNSFDSRGNAFGTNTVSGMNGISSSGIGGISNNNGIF